MEASKLTRGWLKVEGEAVKVFVSKKRLRMLEPFVGGEWTVKAAARRANIKPNLMHDHVTKFVALSLVEVVRLEARCGRAVKHYRAVADGFERYIVRLALAPSPAPCLETRISRRPLTNGYINKLWTVESLFGP